MKGATLLLLVLALPLAGASPLLLPQQGDPDVPAATTPVASVQVFLNERWQFTEGQRTRDMLVPDVVWDRVVMTWESRQVNEPWDRRFGVAVDGVEVLRGTTPRAWFNVTKDVTEYSSLFVPGETVPVSMHLGTWVSGYILASVRFDFYDDEPTAPVARAPFDAVHDAALWAYMSGGSRAGADITFAASQPQRVVLQVTTSGHGQEGEFWWMETPPAVASFRVVVDGIDVGELTAMPYVYALVGFSPSFVTDTLVHPVMWWSAFRAADAAGAHVGVGEVPAYRAEVDASQLALFTGARRVEVVQDTGAGSWVTSLSILVDEA